MELYTALGVGESILVTIDGTGVPSEWCLVMSAASYHQRFLDGGIQLWFGQSVEYSWGWAIGKTGPSVMCDIPEPLNLSSWTVPRASDDRVVAVAQLSDW